MAQTNKVVKLYPPSRDIRVEEVAIPTIEHPDDAIVRVQLAGLCGSDLHAYRGHEPYDSAYVCGHEFVGTIVELGQSFKSANGVAPTSGRAELYETLAVGDKVVSPFTSSCAECQMCRLGFTCRCTKGALFGTTKTPGAQAQYIRVPIAGGTLVKVTAATSATTSTTASLSTLPDSALLLLADILPTDLFATIQLLNHPNVQPWLTQQPYPQFAPLVQDKKNLFPPNPAPNEQDTPLVLAVVGLGPVGVCALIALLDYVYPSGKRNTDKPNPRIIAIDPTAGRRERAAQIIAHYWDKSLIEWIGPDNSPKFKGTVNGVLEVVGNTKALEMSYDLIAPFGVIASVGVHNHHVPLTLTGGALYDKNVALLFGRCPVRALMELAADLLHRRVKIFGEVESECGEAALVERVVPIGEAREAYEKFESGVWGKVLFDPWK